MKILVLVYIISRIFFFAIGVRIDLWQDTDFMQLLPRELMQQHFLQSLWYMHSQPPMFNAIVGIIFRLFGDGCPFVFQCIYWGVGLLLVTTMWKILVMEFKVEQYIATVAVVIFALLPDTVLMENILFYTYPIATLLVCAVYYLQKGLNHE